MQVLHGVEAMAADASRLLNWRVLANPVADAACELAGDLVQWTADMAQTCEEGNTICP